MARRPTPSTRMKKSIDTKNPLDYMWALLEIARIEYRLTGRFETISPVDIKNLLQAISSLTSDTNSNKHTPHITEIRDYLKK